MKKKINIKSIIEYPDCDTETINISADAKFFEKNGKIFIIYEEKQIADGLKTNLQIEDNKASLIRFGEMGSKMVFEKNETHFGFTDTVAGRYSLEITTKKFENNITKNGGSLYLEYEITLNGEITGYNKFELKIKE